MATYESPNGEGVCASYFDRDALASELGTFATLTISDGDDATLDGVSGGGDGNYAIYETPGGAITGLYISHDVLSDVHGNDATPDNAPESVGLSVAPSDEDSFEEAVEEQEEVPDGEVDSLLDSDDSDDSDEEEVEITEDDLLEIEE